MNNQIGVLGFLENLEAYVGPLGKFRIERPYVLSCSKLSQSHLLDAFLAQPGRYVYEMIRRYRSTSPDVKKIIVFNPLLLSNSNTFREVLALTKAEGFFNGVFIGKGNIPLAYSFELDDSEDYRHLVLLSTWDGVLDASLLSRLYRTKFRSYELELSEEPKWFEQNGFELGNSRLPMVWCAKSAINTIESLNRNPNFNLNEFRLMRNRIPIALVCTHHAGDILFMALAASSIKDAIFSHVIVGSIYHPIAQKVTTKIIFEGLDVPIPARTPGYQKPDWEHFLEISEQFAKDRFYVYGRGGRDYNRTDFHLIDQCRFVLGESVVDSSHLYKQLPRRAILGGVPFGMSNKPKKVVLHLGAGWSLKIYPEFMQRQLIGELQACGHQVVTLDSPYYFSNIEQLKFNKLEDFEKLMHDTDIFIGMDSFPAHFSAHILGIPTIYLFSSTHPIHSDFAAQDNLTFYPSLQKGMGCVPCYESTSCKLDGGTICSNFMDPLLVLDAVKTLLDRSPVRSASLPPLPTSEHNRKLPDAYTPIKKLNLKDISLWRIRCARSGYKIALRLNQKQEVIYALWFGSCGNLTRAGEVDRLASRYQSINLTRAIVRIVRQDGFMGTGIRFSNSILRRLKKIFRIG